MDKEQLHAISWLVITISHQSDQLREVEVKSWSLYQWSNRLKCVPGMLLDSMSRIQLVLTVVCSCSRIMMTRRKTMMKKIRLAIFLLEDI